jgi:hypothetical protein
MGRVYRVHEGKALPMEKWHCQNEEVELQDLLENSPDLLAGEQIDPEEPRRWLLVKREMAVPDPLSGASRWSCDFLYVDQDAILTFVECKRHDDTRSRREVIAQVLDYAANAPRLWKVDTLRAAAEETHTRGKTLDQALRDLEPTEAQERGDLFVRAIENLKDYKFRIILFLDEAPPELKTVVEFLIKEFSRVEIVLIEAKRYRIDGLEVVAPTVWGYTEQVREQRQAVAEALGFSRARWDEQTFFRELSERVSDEARRKAVRKLFDELRDPRYRLSWGSGQTASFNVRFTGVTVHSALSIRADGDLTANYAGLVEPKEVACAQRLAAALQKELGIARHPNFPNCYQRIECAKWAPRVDDLLRIFDSLAEPTEAAESILQTGS